MIKEKQIETTDWLTRDISQEQLKREKQEAIMSAHLEECVVYDEYSSREYGIEAVDFDATAAKMVAKGYQKSSDVAAEIFADIKQKIADLEYNAKVPRKTVTVETLMEQVNWVLHEVVPETLDEIEKKYTESEDG